MFKTALITDLHRTNREWLNLINFYRDEIRVMEKRMSEIASKNTVKDVLANLEHFQNQVIIQKAHLDDMQGDIVQLEDVISDEIKKNQTAADHRRHAIPEKLNQDMEQFRKLFYELRKDFMEYMVKVM